ncbi:MAG: AAA family ATPase [Candidatus Nomurabacteria bacterium]|nr:MAG: AAA family ATPase [Candidatus Nomurabacteria bacterium]
MGNAIQRINKIKNLGLVFSNYVWGSGIRSRSTLPNFKQLNLVYGWNGSGKTTLSRLFDALSGVSIENLEYEIEDENGNRYDQNDTFPPKVRVFNRDYIERNIELIEGRANSISILLGEENKDLAVQIKKDRTLLNGDSSDPKQRGKIARLADYKKDHKRLKASRDGQFTEIAKTIGAAIGGNALRDYRRPQAESDFSKINRKVELEEVELNNILISLKQESLPFLDRIFIPKVEIDQNNYEISEIVNSINTEAENVLNKKVESEIINRLAENNDISEWVEEGVKLHKRHSSDVCEYCLQNIPNDRVEQLALYFNNADKKLKEDLDSLVEKLRKLYSVIQNITIPEKTRFYKDLQTNLETEKVNFELAKQQFVNDITNLADKIKSKKSKTTERVEHDKKLSSIGLYKVVDSVNAIIDEHKKRTADFDTVKQRAAEKIKFHYLSTIFDDIKKIESDISNLTKNIDTLTKEIEEINKRIEENTAKISSKHKACEVINEKIATYLGHRELKFVPRIETVISENGDEKEVVSGYNIMRDDSAAKYLSEGEKTAIAFIYFVVHLEDQSFDLQNGIILIDDPVSSLDSNSLYQAFSFLKGAVKDGGQVFIFTHSFDFLKLLINWRRGAGRDNTGYFMIKNYFPSNIRCAYIDRMDKELCEYESEYHYLFKLLKYLRDEQDDSIAKAYPIPNIARKVWDTFLMFSVPNGKKSYKKIEELKQNGYDEQKLDAIYKFTNDQSHITGSGFNPALVPETKKIVNELFEMMEKIAPNHYQIINDATKD